MNSGLNWTMRGEKGRESRRDTTDQEAGRLA